MCLRQYLPLKVYRIANASLCKYYLDNYVAVVNLSNFPLMIQWDYMPQTVKTETHGDV